MPQSLAAVYIHLVYSTKNRQPFLRDPEIRKSMHSYLDGTSKTLECPPLNVCGVDDYVHLLCPLDRTLSLADWVKEIKRVANLWFKKEYSAIGDFEWQSGYGAFSVSQSNLDQVTAYIENQGEHHKTMSFQDELRGLLRRHNLEWDERYVWD